MPETPTGGRNRRRALAWAAVAMLLSLGLARLHDYRGWDQNVYLAQASSLAEDGDVDLRNDLLHLHREPSTLLRALTTLEPTGALSNTFAVGTSILWLPPYVLTMPWRALTAQPEARWSRLQLVALQLAALSVMVWLLWVFDRWLRRMGVERWPAALAALALVLGTPLVSYGFRAYMGSHLTSAVAVMLLVLATLRLGDRGTAGSAWLWGIALGLVFLCRWQDVVKGVVLLVPVLELRRRGLTMGRWGGLAVTAAAGALLMAGVQLHAWLLERGEIFGLPQGPRYLELAEPEIGRFLFSGLSGLLPWSPLFAIGLIGLLLPWRCRLPVAWRWVALALLLFDIYLNASVRDWWGGTGYGARRMCSDVPLLALGLGNLACWRRLRLPLAGALAICCLWGGVTANLRVHGLRDLGILVHGRSSAPDAEVGTAQPSRAEALEVATSWPFHFGKMSYSGRHSLTARLLTVAVGALACWLTGWALGRARAPGRLGVVLLVVLALAVFAHLRLLGAERVDAGDRELWARLSRVAAGRVETGLSPGMVEAIEDREDGFTEGRRFLHAAALMRQGLNRQASAVIADLGPYPFKPHLLESLSMEAGRRLLVKRPGFFHQVRETRPARSLTRGRKMDLGCEAVRLSVAVKVASFGPGTDGRLVSLGRRGEPPLAAVEVPGEGRIALRTAAGRQEAPLLWHPSGTYRLQLDWLPTAGRAELSAAGPGGDSAELAVPAVAGDSGSGRFEVVIGTPRPAKPGHEPFWGSRFSDLRVTARDVCRAPT